MQAGGRRFEPDRLHQSLGAGSEGGGFGRFVAEKCRNSVLWVLVEQAARAVPFASPVGMLIFVRVNQVLERLWARPIVKSDRMVGGFGLRTSCDRKGSEARKVPLCLARVRIARVGLMDPVVC